VTIESTEETIWMSTAALDVLKAELSELSGPTRAEIVERIAAARDEGDLKENGGYHAAKEEQGKLEARIKQLDELIRVADTTPPSDDDVVTPGKLVTLDPEFTDRQPFLLAMRTVENAYPSDLEVISPASPLGGTILGASKGDVVEFNAPNGKVFKLTVTDVTPYA
jgi:transcription elongation factor GreA